MRLDVFRRTKGQQMITIERKKFIVSAWANWSAFRIGADWNFIKGYWTITFMFAFWSLDISKKD